MLSWRLFLGTVFVGGLAALCWWDARLNHPGMVLFPLAILLTVAATDELVTMLAAGGRQPLAWVAHLGNLLIVGSNAVFIYWPLGGVAYPADCLVGKLGWPLGATCVAMILAFLGEMRRYTQPGATIVQLGMSALAHVYVGLLLSCVVQLRHLHDGPTGMIALVSLVAVVKACDIGAYTCGRLVGRHKMTPVLSPGKTWEGTVGGLVFAATAAWLVFRYLAPAIRSDMAPSDSVPAWGWLAYGLLVGAAGVIGDLAESLLKRDAGVKDSSCWMPGFGGVLDILDSILLAAPIAYGCWAVGLVR